MIRKVLRCALIFSLVGLFSGCSLHQRMHEKAYHLLFGDERTRGQVVSVDGDQAVLCIDSTDDTQVGKVLKVSQVKHEEKIESEADTYTLQDVGTIEITSIINEHFARGHILHGGAEQNDVVESSEH